MQAPLTADFSAVKDSLSELDTGIIPRGGTNLKAAIEAANDAFGKGESENRALIIFTDGEELEEDTLIVTPTSFRRRYTDWLPSLNIRYEARKDLIFRGAVSRSVVRPNIEQLAPIFLVEENDEGDRLFKFDVF